MIRGSSRMIRHILDITLASTKIILLLSDLVLYIQIARVNISLHLSTVQNAKRVVMFWVLTLYFWRKTRNVGLCLAWVKIRLFKKKVVVSRNQTSIFETPDLNLFSQLWRKKKKFDFQEKLEQKNIRELKIFLLWSVLWLSERKNVLKKKRLMPTYLNFYRACCWNHKPASFSQKRLMPTYLNFFIGHVVGIINPLVCSQDLYVSVSVNTELTQIEM